MGFSKKYGYVYILTNSAFKNNLVKIGMTTRTPEERAMEIYQTHTGVPTKFEVVYKRKVRNCVLAEEIIHNQLYNFRTNVYREFFKISIDKAKKVINEICEKVDKLYGESVVKTEQKQPVFCVGCGWRIIPGRECPECARIRKIAKRQKQLFQKDMLQKQSKFCSDCGWKIKSADGCDNCRSKKQKIKTERTKYRITDQLTNQLDKHDLENLKLMGYDISDE